MSDRAALYAAVCANPDDDTPRLVFADWLDENGEAKRAAFIRAQVELHRTAGADTPAAAAYETFEAESPAGYDILDWSAVDAEVGAIAAAVAATRKARFAPTKRGENLPRVKGVTFEAVARGFFTGVVVKDADAFLANADAIFRAAPVTAAEFGALTAGQARELAARGHLARLRSLTFHGALRLLHLGSSRLTARGLAALGECPAVRGLWFLSLRGCEVSDAGLAALAKCADFRHLTALELRSNRLTAAGMRTLAAWPAAANLRWLDVCDNLILEPGGRALAESPYLTKLERLDANGRGAKLQRKRFGKKVVPSP